MYKKQVRLFNELIIELIAENELIAESEKQITKMQHK